MLVEADFDREDDNDRLSLEEAEGLLEGLIEVVWLKLSVRELLEDTEDDADQLGEGLGLIQTKESQ